MKCSEFTEFIADYLAGEVAPEVRERFERHLSRCGNCSRYLEGYKESMNLGKAAFRDLDAPLPGDVPEDLVNAVLSARRDQSD